MTLPPLRALFAATVAAAAVAGAAITAGCSATEDRLDAPQPTAAPAVVNVTASPTRTPTATPTPEPLAPGRATPTQLPEPTATPLPTSTAVPTAPPTPTPTPEPPRNADLEVLTLLVDLGLNPRLADITIVGPDTWPDLSLGCGPQSGNVPAVEVQGYVIHADVSGAQYVFHVAEHEGETITIDCTGTEVATTATLNPTRQFRLREASSVVFSRLNSAGGYDPVRIVDDAATLAVWADALDAELPIGNDARCETAFRMEFRGRGGSQVVDFFCEADWFRIGGTQPEWNGTQGAMPRAVLDLIAPILADQPLPELPDVNTEVATDATPAAALPSTATATVDATAQVVASATVAATATATTQAQAQIAVQVAESINPIATFGLLDAESIVFLRSDGDGGYDPLAYVEAADAAPWIAALDLDLDIGITETCATAYRIEFRFPDGSQTFDFFCTNDWYRIGGAQAEWGGTQGVLPHAILDLVAPFLAAQPLPGIPEVN